MEKVRSGGRKEVKCKELNKKLLKNYDSQKRIFELLPSLLLFPIMDCCHSFSPKCKLIFHGYPWQGKRNADSLATSQLLVVFLWVMT